MIRQTDRQIGRLLMMKQNSEKENKNRNRDTIFDFHHQRAAEVKLMRRQSNSSTVKGTIVKREESIKLRRK